MAAKLFAGFERQRYDRIKRACDTLVRVPSAEPDGRDRCLRGKTLNFSAGGMLCELDEKLIEKMVVHVEIDVPHWARYILACPKKSHQSQIVGQPFRATGRVLRAVKHSASGKFIMAVQFVHVDPDVRRAMKKYVSCNV